MGHSKDDGIFDLLLGEPLGSRAILSAQLTGVSWILPGSVGHRISAAVVGPSPY